MIWPNNNRPNKCCIPTHSCGQAVYSIPEVHDGLAELDEMLSLKRLGEVIRNHVFIVTVIDF